MTSLDILPNTVSKCLNIYKTLRDPRRLRSAISSMRHRETRISRTSGLPSIITGAIIPRGWDIPKIREVSRSGAREKKGRDWMLEEKKIGVIVSKEFFRRALIRTHARTHVTCVLVGRDDPPTHNCWRLVVDDNGNPIFRNNICLEDRRLTSCDTDVYTCLFVCARAVRNVSFLPWRLSSFHSILWR